MAILTLIVVAWDIAQGGHYAFFIGIEVIIVVIDALKWLLVSRPNNGILKVDFTAMAVDSLMMMDMHVFTCLIALFFFYCLVLN